MHYSPIMPGLGLLAAAKVLPLSTGLGSVARTCFNVAGILFLLLAALLIVLDTIGRLHDIRASLNGVSGRRPSTAYGYQDSAVPSIWAPPAA
ncbi:hypothetical protein DDD63_04595 [Actinobaculum sp. 313]|nr:hypothetical protein DDD63_04595 [Actinobaculum sp. 313]